MSIPPANERILIVDDEDQIRTLLARLLGAHGYDCLTAESAAAARRVLKETDVALVLSDVNMPGESGIDFTREVLAQYPDMAVVMVTGMDDRSYADAAIELGAYGYVLKPFKPNELIINVGNAFRRRALEIENRTSRERLERTVLDRTAALRDTIAQLESSDAELRPAPRGDDPPPLVGRRVPQPGDRRAHRPHEPLLRAARAARRAWTATTPRRSGSRARCTTSARSGSRTGSCSSPAG
jgi:DNA-binding NarL/FixJ family response regulator